ncbi:MAG TPA: 30S ribosomal protein S17 [Cyanobacteria bacterium UBA9971]|nr:30S ribosomal protein S17 [Cyanobacteria bacterium UBA9971]
MPKKEKTGLVVSTKMDKTIVVEVAEYKPHPIYKKIISTTKKYKAHNTEFECHLGDEVKIIECKPLSKTKLWQLAAITKKAT